MSTYDFAQLEQLWEQAGGSPAWAPTMAAVAEIESSGNPAAYNSSGATGLWQVLQSNDPGANLTNPEVNAREAVTLLGPVGAGNAAPGIDNWGYTSSYNTGDAVGIAAENNHNEPLPPATLQSILNANGHANVTVTTPTNATVTAAPGGGWDPLNWPGDIAHGIGSTATSAVGSVGSAVSSATSSVWTDIVTLGLKLALTALAGGICFEGVKLLAGRSGKQQQAPALSLESAESSPLVEAAAA
jgi:hypothetical protein